MIDSVTSRRNFLRRCLVCTGGAATAWGVGPLLQLARAAEGAGAPAVPPDRHFVFAYFSGGWDILLGLDPRDPAVFNDGNVSMTRIQPAYDQLQAPPNGGLPVQTAAGITFGPYIGELAKHAERLAVVRGMSMDTLTHEVGRRRFLTGKPPSGLLARGSSAATWLSARLGEAQPIPNLSVRVETYNVDQPNWASGLKVANVPDLLRTLRNGDPAPDALVDAHVDALLRETAQCAGAAASPAWQKAESSRLKAR